tara:strand:+ start:155 stop:454 length:300 start_codon:yes stop_codon:yes gene_type:complete
MRKRGSSDGWSRFYHNHLCDSLHIIFLQSKQLGVIMVKGKLERKYKLIHNGRELSKGLLSEAGKFDAMQILVQRFDEGREDAIDPDEVEIIDMSLKENQ